MISLQNNKIIITYDEQFNPKAIFECGQVFRYTVRENNYTVYADQYAATIENHPDYYSITSNNAKFFYKYFDLDTDYNLIIERIKNKPYMEESFEYGKGLRILKQDYFECIISFIISANNNIKRISGILNRLCEKLGKNYGKYYGFPEAEVMAKQTVEFYKSIGAGYRSEYILTTAKLIADGFDINAIENMDTLSAKRALMSLKGIGSKVADCILLFSYSRKDVFPVDTWIKKVYCKLGGDQKCVENMRKYLLDLYGEYAGYAQQYLFYAHRSGKL